VAEGGATEQHVVEDPGFKQRFSFRRLTDDGGGEVLEVKVWVEPGGGVPAHMHPAMEERFHVQSGRPDFLAGRKWQTGAPGETVVVPPGMRHAYRNKGDEVAHFICHARPPSTLQEFLEDAAALGRAGKITRHGFPKGFDALVRAAVMVHHNRDMTVLGFPLPPRPLQRLIIPPLARIGERRGYRAGHLGKDVRPENRRP
jgi:quercetin dioxygenase-like cupin family protein